MRIFIPLALLIAVAMLVICWSGCGDRSTGSEKAGRVDRLSEAIDIHPVSLSPSTHRLPLDLSERVGPRDLEVITSKFLPKHRMPTLSHLLHYLYAWGPEYRPADGDCLSGEQMLRAITEGVPSPLFPTDRTIAYRNAVGEVRFAEGDDLASETHVDQTLCTLAEVGVPLDQPLLLADGTATLGEALSASLNNYVLDQEQEWSISAYLRYLPPQKSWSNKWGETFDFDLAIRRLVNRPPDEGPCHGTHALSTICLALRIDGRFDILTEQTEQLVIGHLKHASNLLERNQHPDGCWPYFWHREDSDGFVWFPEGEAEDMLLATGHHLEWIRQAPPEAVPSRDSMRKALEWCLHFLAGSNTESIVKNPCPYSHALKCLYILSYPGLSPDGYLPDHPSD